MPVVLLAVRATMATRTANSTFGVLLAVFFVLASSLVGADKPDFSGSYTLTSTKGAAKVNKCAGINRRGGADERAVR